jgi:plasmid stabilization system protein ParE
VIRPVTFRPEADRELVDAFVWYEQKREGLGTEFARAVVELVTRITEHPLAFPRVYGELRRATLRRFPYAIYFRLSADDIVVLAVHGRQDPRRWRSRR